ncbi:hypothetical protein TNCV_2122691 [Trichonephila clavipes]|nr:hypothetical protein TNCV_2122691 [Trichonephila clavipes]
MVALWQWTRIRSQCVMSSYLVPLKTHRVEKLVHVQSCSIFPVQSGVTTNIPFIHMMSAEGDPKEDVKIVERRVHDTCREITQVTIAGGAKNTITLVERNSLYPNLHTTLTDGAQKLDLSR